MRKQNIIFFSSFNSLGFVNTLVNKLNESEFVNAISWQSCFKTMYEENYEQKKSYPLFRFLNKNIPSFDFAVIVSGKDNVFARNDKGESLRMRDNIVFELGMCSMALGESRVILLHQKDVELFANLGRGRAKEFFSEIEEYHSTALTIDNIQIKAFEYTDNCDKTAVNDICQSIVEYVKDKAAEYDPVVVGAACSTASGYYGNFIERLAGALKKKSGFEKYDLEHIELHIVLPEFEIQENETQESLSLFLKDPKQASDEMFFSNPEYGIQKRRVDDSGRSIEFAYKEGKDKLYIVDIPTTILASYKTIHNIMKIADDVSKNEKTIAMYFAKEMNMFKSTLQKIIELDSGLGVKCVIDEISFEKSDKQIPEWLKCNE